MLSRSKGYFSTAFLASWTLGILAFLSVVLTLTGPGITIDEPLDVRPGRTYVETLLQRGWGFFDRQTVVAVFRDNAEHPPLGRWLLGIASKVFQPGEMALLGRDPLNAPTGMYVRSGRMAPAFCFSILVGLITSAAGKRYGVPAGVAAGFSLLVMPRVFAHAHLGALDTFVALFWTLALLKAVEAVDKKKPAIAMLVAGIFWGLALLTKIHGWLLPPVVLVWTFYRLPWKVAIVSLLAWTASGLIVFFAGWPWLWYDTIPRLSAYFGTGVVRSVTNTLYFGQVYADRETPWHYPWVYFLATVPLGLHVLGGLGVYFGVRERRSDPMPLFLMMTIVAVLLLFSTRVPVYDGERLFLPVFPLWAILIGKGFGSLWYDLVGRTWLRAGLIAAVAGQGVAVVAIHPFGLSFYNSLVGGLPGAERLGMELTYWNDAVDDVLLDEVARRADPGATAALAPTLVPDQGKVVTTRRMFFDKDMILADEDATSRSEWVIISRREAYWKPEIRELVKTPPEFLRVRQGVWLSGAWRRLRANNDAGEDRR